MALSFIVRAFYVNRSFSLVGKTHIASIIPILSGVVFLVIMVVKSSLALSLGLVGALSIVRFRTPIKEPEELVYLFLAIGVGLGLGAGQSMLTSIIVLLILLFTYFFLSNKKINKVLEYNLIIKPHMWTYYLDSFVGVNLKGQRKLIYNLSEKFDHVKLLSPDEHNIIPYYSISDLLLTEASSTIYEMIALSKPVVVNRFYHLKLSHRIFQKRLYKRRLNKEMNDEVKNFCFLADNIKQLPFVLDEAIKHKHKDIVSMREYQKKMLYKLDGQASNRARDEILRRLKN